MELNGRSVNLEDIMPLTMLNYGNFTTVQVDSGRVRGLEIHLERLVRDSKKLFGQSIDPAIVRQLIRQATADQNEPTWVRVTVFCRELDLASPEKPAQLDILITKRQGGKGDMRPLTVKPVVFERDLPEVKSVNIGGALYRRRQARLEGFDDALFVNSQGEISEGPTWNIAFVREGQIILPSTPSLAGVSVVLLTKALTGHARQPKIQTVTLDDMKHMDAAFALNATYGPRSIAKIGKHEFANSVAEFAHIQKLYQSVPYEEL